jgi:hypothetical protein
MFQDMVVLWKYHTYHVMLVNLGVVSHTFVRVLTKIGQKWCPLVKLPKSVCINGKVGKVHMWAPGPVKHVNIK